MFNEHLAKFTADHLRTHIAGYLSDINAEYSGTDKTTLVVPKEIIVASAVGGLIQEIERVLPKYAIDALTKERAEVQENLVAYQYQGQINGLVSAGSQEAVDVLVKRHARAVETFVKQHEFLHKHSTDNFSVIGFIYLNTEFSGAEMIQAPEGERQIWLAGFSCDVVWLTSEEAEMQH